jgi:hypothetical protein
MLFFVGGKEDLRRTEGVILSNSRAWIAMINRLRFTERPDSLQGLE